MRLIDTHCHIHDSEFTAKYEQTPDQIIQDAHKNGVVKLICVGTSTLSSIEAIAFCKGRDAVYCSVAIHPHEVADNSVEKLAGDLDSLERLIAENKQKIVAIGECGLDYFYHSDHTIVANQKILLTKHIEIAIKHQLPLIFHIRDSKTKQKNQLGDAFKDFFEIIDQFDSLRGVVHSFSAGMAELKGCVQRGLNVGLNGIITFTKEAFQLEAAKAVPIENLLLETDAPFLTPAPFRGKMCLPKHIGITAKFLSELRGENLEELAEKSSLNAEKLFGI